MSVLCDAINQPQSFSFRHWIISLGFGKLPACVKSFVQSGGCTIDACRIAFTLSGSIAIPSLLTMCPSSVPPVTLNTYFVGFKFKLDPRHFSRHVWRWSELPDRLPVWFVEFVLPVRNIRRDGFGDIHLEKWHYFGVFLQELIYLLIC